MLFPAHCPSPVIPVGFCFIHNSVFPSLLPLVLSGTLVSVFQFYLGLLIYLAQPERFLYADHSCIPVQGFSPGPHTLRVKRFPATRSCPLPFVHSLCYPLLRASTMQNHCQLESFLNAS